MTLSITGSIVTGEAVELEVFANVGEWAGKFDTLEVWRSRLTEGGPYEPMMGNSWLPARIPAIEGDAPVSPQSGPSAALDGLELELLVNEAVLVTIVFSGGNPWTYGDAATEIQGGSSGLLRAFVLNNKLVIETRQPGSGAILKVVGGDAAPLLGLPTAEPESVAFGLDARILLLNGMERYLFTDLHGSKDYFYKSRYFNRLSGVSSGFSTPFSGDHVAALPLEHLIRGFADFVGASGRAVANQEILIHFQLDGRSVSNRVVVPVAPARLLSDINGHVELMLVRGSKITVAVAGTDLVRDIDVPTDSAISSFNLLDPSKGKNDLFKVQVPEFEYAARRSL